MTWPIAFTVVSAFAALVAFAHVALPYVRKRSDAETRLEALEAANHELRDRTARLEQFAEGGGPLGRLPRAGRVA